MPVGGLSTLLDGPASSWSRLQRVIGRSPDVPLSNSISWRIGQNVRSKDVRLAAEGCKREWKCINYLSFALANDCKM